MWGNTKGWIYSGLIAIALLWLMWDLGRVPPAPPVSGTFPQLLKPIELPVSPEVIRQAESPCDAGDLYRQAIQLYLRKPSVYDSFFNPAPARSGGKAVAPLDKVQGAEKRLEGLPTLEALDLILKGADCRDMVLFVRKPEDVVNYKSTEPHLEAIRKLGELTIRLGVCIKPKAIQPLPTDTSSPLSHWAPSSTRSASFTRNLTPGLG